MNTFSSNTNTNTNSNTNSNDKRFLKSFTPYNAILLVLKSINYHDINEDEIYNFKRENILLANAMSMNASKNCISSGKSVEYNRFHHDRFDLASIVFKCNHLLALNKIREEYISQINELINESKEYLGVFIDWFDLDNYYDYNNITKQVTLKVNYKTQFMLDYEQLRESVKSVYNRLKDVLKLNSLPKNTNKSKLQNLTIQIMEEVNMHPEWKHSRIMESISRITDTRVTSLDKLNIHDPEYKTKFESANQKINDHINIITAFSEIIHQHPNVISYIDSVINININSALDPRKIDTRKRSNQIASSVIPENMSNKRTRFSSDNSETIHNIFNTKNDTSFAGLSAIDNEPTYWSEQ